MTELLIRDERVRQTAIDLLAKLDVSRPWSVTIKRHVKNRSSNQNALFHKWCSIISKDVGDDIESVKYDLKTMFLETVERASPITGEIRMEPKRTRDLNTAEMSEFMTKVDAFASSQLGILLPHPEEMHARV